MQEWGDPQRSLQRLCFNRGGPRDLVKIKNCFKLVKGILELLQGNVNIYYRTQRITIRRITREL